MATDWMMSDFGTVSRGDDLRALLAAGKSVQTAGAYDGMTARLARDAGFEALYLSGAALSASMALPDLGLLTLEDVRLRAKQIVRASDLPLIVDCDTGFGEALNVMQLVRDMEEIGVACIQIEDQKFPKKCGHLNDKQLISRDDMCRKIAAARKAADRLIVCARTDAAAESLDDALDRARAYRDAGAELIFVEALASHEIIRRVREQLDMPLLANMTEFGRTPHISMREWQEIGYEVVIYPVSAFRVAMKAARDFYAKLYAGGTAEPTLDTMLTRAELYETISYYDYEALDENIARTVL
ncbi:methylisocitrate lyase [Paracoccus onubensis]|uniref:methylisocitrate lyase n=1 Tax=Paracoccus onubensis TaxID=1675788 RepID=UPI002731A4F7|nr:methylisocitrate lyase [Paracoccus onubensis]MDP0926652.1 methylisocitrate lyase [Paracoccus onubensis]